MKICLWISPLFFFVPASVAQNAASVSVGFSYSFSGGIKIGPVKRTQGSANEEQGRLGQ